jgi:hypothetical protein
MGHWAEISHRLWVWEWLLWLALQDTISIIITITQLLSIVIPIFLKSTKRKRIMARKKFLNVKASHTGCLFVL